MAPHEVMEHMRLHPRDALHLLSGPDRRLYFFSMDGDVRFARLVERHLKGLGVEGLRHDFEAVFSAVKSEFMRRSLDEALKITEENAGEVFQAALASLDAGYGPLTHYIPCAIVADTKPDRFEIGPVKFVLRDAFLNENEGRIRQGLTHHGELLLPRLLDYLKESRWVAILTVPPCHPTVSTQRAHEVVQRCLDLSNFSWEADEPRW
jgi:hypothetical protein